MIELRCPGGVLYGILDEDEGVVEFKCRDRRTCGHRPGTVVLHRFDLTTGKMLDERVYQDPKQLFNQGG